jgi:hypothetical protein
MKAGELAYSNVGGEKLAKRPTYRIARRDIIAWMEANKVRQGPSKTTRQDCVKKWFAPKAAI